MSKQKIYIASDHAGVELKKKLLIKFGSASGSTSDLTSALDVEWIDLGPASTDRVDYPDFAKKLCEKLKSDLKAKGILICGSGIGMSIAANRFSWIRAALVENPVAAKLSREHNDSNVLCLASRFLATEYAQDIALTWLTTPYSEDPRHKVRLSKLTGES